MAGADRMTIEEVVRKVLLDEHADVIRAASRTERLPDWMGPGNATDWEDWLDKTDAGGVSNRQKVIRGSKKL